MTGPVRGFLPALRGPRPSTTGRHAGTATRVVAGAVADTAVSVDGEQDSTPVGAGGAGGTADGATADGGSAIVEFVLVGTLLLIVILGVIQVGLVLHVRNTLAADAAEGARHAANVDVPATEGGTYAQQLIAESLPGRSDAVCTGQDVDGPGGIPLVRVTCTVVVPLSLVPLGDGVTLTVTGHAVKEVP